MKQSKLEEYITTRTFDPKSKHIVFISNASGITKDELSKIVELNPGVMFVITRGNPNDLILSIEATE